MRNNSLASINKQKDRKFTSSLARGLSILGAFDQSHPRLGIADLARITGLSKSTIYRLVYTLRSLGYVILDGQGHKYTLGPKVLDLGFAVLSSLDIREIAQPYLLRLSHLVKETVNLAVLDEWNLVYVERIKTQQIVNINLHVGSRLELYNTAMGRVLAAFRSDSWLKQYLKYLKKIPEAEPYWKNNGGKLLKILSKVRNKDFSLNNQELTPGLLSVASPVRNREGQVVAAVNIAVSSSRYSVETLKKEMILPLRQTTQAISLALGFRS
jgi:IclR family pca regulon transcriptional regulator